MAIAHPMTRRECVLAAIRHEAPDVIPQQEGFMDEELAADFGSRHYPRTGREELPCADVRHGRYNRSRAA